MKLNSLFFIFLFIIILANKSLATNKFNEYPIIMASGVGRDIRFFVSPDVTEEDLKKLVGKFISMGINYVQFYDTMPDYGSPYSEKELWLHTRNEFYRKKGLAKDIVISKSKIKLLISLLHKNNIKAIYYDEICSKNKEFNIYPPFNYTENAENFSLPYFYKEDLLNKLNKPISLYGIEYGYDANIELIKERYVAELSKMVKEVGFDGIFLDSLTWLCEASSFGKNYKGEIFNKTPDNICNDFITKIKKELGRDFLVIGNNGFYKNPLIVYNQTSKSIDVWNVEFPSNQLIQKISLYPKTFSELNEAFAKGYYNMVIFEPFFDTNNTDIYKIFMAITFSNGVNIYHKNDYLGDKNLAEVISKYNNFVRKNADIYFGTKTKFDKNSINVSPDILYNFYQTDSDFVVNLINVDAKNHIWNFPKIFKQDIYINMDRQFCLKEVESLTPENSKIKITKKITPSDCVIAIPTFDTWLTLRINKNLK